jgi:LacI family transcriptional regulator
MKVRIKDIARLAQVSPGTVDRVIHNRGEVSEKTRKKVDEIIQELNYQPDILARTLASKRNYSFSVLMPVSVHDNDFWNSPKAGIEKALAEVSPFGVEVKQFLFDQFDIKSFEENAEKLLTNTPDAILFAPVFPKKSVEFIKNCKQKNIPLILFNSNLEEAENTMYIGQDALQSGYLAAKLLHYGLKEEGDLLIINIAGRKDNHNHLVRRERGFRKYFADNPTLSSEIFTLDCMQNPVDDLQCRIDEALDRFKVRAIFVTNSRVFQVAEYLDKIELSNIRLLGYDLLPQNISMLREGKIDFLISQKPEEQGYKGVMTVFNHVVLKREIQEVQYIPIDIITKENIDYYEYK